ncbi:MAG: hypothetical protein PHE04_01965 [Bacteroidales bacterium]|nr:hypothetical protein [Bacteroidales bacterium]
MKEMIELSLARLCKQCFGQEMLKMQEIPACGSYRQYYRIYLSAPAPSSIIGAWNADFRENAAFVSFAQSFIRPACLSPKFMPSIPKLVSIYSRIWAILLYSPS